MLKQITKTNNKINANAVGVAPLGDPQTKNIKDKSIANAVGADSISAHKKTTKNTLKEHSNLTSQKGITLIALVITIIIMLILVTVTITVALKGELFNTAKQAKTETENKINEEQNLASGKVEIDGKWYKSIDDYIAGNPIPTVDDYGDFVEYGVDLNNDGNKTNDWKVFYVDDEGRTFIIAADYVNGDKCSALQTAAEINSKMTHNTGENEYCYYWDFNNGNPTVTYDCYDKHNETIQNEHTQNTQQCSYPDIFMGTGYYCSDHVGTDGKSGNANSRCASSLMCTENWKDFVDEKYGASYAIGGATLEMWVASWNKKHGKDVDKDNGITLCAKPKSSDSSCTGYYIGEGENATNYYKFITSCTDGYNDTLYFPHKNYNDNLDGNDGTTESCHGYWLASPCASGISYLMSVSCSGNVEGPHYSNSSLRCSTRSLSNIWSQISRNSRRLDIRSFRKQKLCKHIMHFAKNIIKNSIANVVGAGLVSARNIELYPKK